MKNLFPSLLFLLLPLTLHAHITITALDVGQGDAVLIQHESYIVLIDGGRQENLVADYLRAQGVSQVHLLVATHAYADHFGGLGDKQRPSFGILNNAVSSYRQSG